MKKLCDKQGNGVCYDCSESFKETVLCRQFIAEYVHYMEETMEDMTNFMYRHCDKFDTQKDVLEYFDFKFRDGRVIV